MREIDYLEDLVNLRKLSLAENPICELKNYRLYVIKLLPRLEKLDDIDVTNEEVEKA